MTIYSYAAIFNLRLLSESGQKNIYRFSISVLLYPPSPKNWAFDTSDGGFPKKNLSRNKLNNPDIIRWSVFFFFTLSNINHQQFLTRTLCHESLYS